MKQRTEYFDFLRGLAILMVIAIHTFPTCGFDSIGGYLQILIRQMVGCPVPIFLAISGYFVGKKNLDFKQDKISFWKKQIPKVYIPALLWSIFYFGFSIKNGGNMAVALGMLFFMGYSIYYFIALIIQCYLLLPMLQKINGSVFFWGGVILAVSILSGIAIAWLGCNKFPLTVYAGPFTTWLVFFYMGVILSKSGRTYNIGLYFCLLPISIIAMMAEAYLLDINAKSGAGLKPTVYIYSLLIILILFSKKVQDLYNERNRLNKIISHIGKISFGIYLIHCIVLMILGQIINTNAWVIKWILVATISIFIIVISRRFLPDRVNKYIGFK